MLDADDEVIWENSSANFFSNSELISKTKFSREMANDISSYHGLNFRVLNETYLPLLERISFIFLILSLNIIHY